MQTPSPETLFVTADRTSSELLWSVAQLSAVATDAHLRQRTAEMLEVVISGLQLNYLQLSVQPKDLHHAQHP